jgi:hypothetical protein
MQEIDDFNSEEYLCLREAWAAINEQAYKQEKLEKESYEAEMKRSQEFEFKTDEVERQQKKDIRETILRVGEMVVKIAVAVIPTAVTIKSMQQNVELLQTYNKLENDNDNPKIITSPAERAFINKLAK